VGVALAVSIVIVDASFQHARDHILTTTAADQAREVADLNPEMTPRLDLPADANIDTGLVQVIRNGQVLAASRLLRGFPPLWSAGDATIQTEGPLLSAKDVHVINIPMKIGSSPVDVEVVVSLDQYDRSVSVLERIVRFGLPVFLVLIGVLCWLIVGRALRPIEMMRREVDEVASIRGGHRIAAPPHDDEVGRLARTLNSMLDRVEASSERERRFVSDASHELRSPIANIRTEIEVALHHPRTTDWDTVAQDVLVQNERMASLVGALLLLARSDEGSLVPALEATDLAEVAESVVAERRDDRPRMLLDIQSAYVKVPLVYLERVVSNLVDNARRFAGSRVEISVRAVGEWGVLRVKDDGPGVPESDRTRIFERFVRLDEARDRDEGGFGLGLAIVADLCRFYGGSIEVESASPGAVFVLRFPLSADAPVLPVVDPARVSDPLPT
jgi:signal transduction histidine kinase